MFIIYLKKSYHAFIMRFTKLIQIHHFCTLPVKDYDRRAAFKRSNLDAFTISASLQTPIQKYPLFILWSNIKKLLNSHQKHIILLIAIFDCYWMYICVSCFFLLFLLLLLFKYVSVLSVVGVSAPPTICHYFYDACLRSQIAKSN